MKKPIIGVAGNVFSYSNAAYSNIEKSYVNKRYIDAVESNGGIPLIIPFSEDFENLPSLLALCDGILIPGGEDIDPSLYNEGPQRFLGEIKPLHDRFLIQILEYAKKNRKSCLGICKGMQLMAVFAGGTLYQDISSQREGESFLHCQHENRDYPLHSVKIKRESYLFEILQKEEVSVNSMHHQSIKSLKGDFSTSALSDDGVIEAIEDESHLFVGVQWHPEELFIKSEIMSRLFADLVKRALSK
ncbi:MAG: gamma-glutamyl-gamma-aminobutyrate hydrolase family protein [Oscillospiraceae bacterium]